MELYSVEFLSALAAIVVIDLVLAGDNAIVIALAARSLPRHLQKQAIVWGTFGAIVVRSAMTMVVVWLLKIPGLMLIGGALLVWIALRLLAPQESGEDGHGPTATTFWGAMKTIVIADAVMGLDNVLAVAGAAHGSYLLVVLGLLISIPIVIWGSTLILKWVERFPSIVYLGAGVLAWTAVKMMINEPLVKDAVAANGALAPLAYLAVIGGVLWAGFVLNHRRLDSRITARLAEMRRGATPFPEATYAGDSAMQRILIPVDGSRNAEFAVRHVIAEFMKDSAKEVHLLNVQPPLSQHIAQFVSRRNRDDWHRDQAEKALAPARRLLGQHSAHATDASGGDRARVIADGQRAAARLPDRHEHRAQELAHRMLRDSTTGNVLGQTSVRSRSSPACVARERWGLPAGVRGADRAASRGRGLGGANRLPAGIGGDLPPGADLPPDRRGGNSEGTSSGSRNLNRAGFGR
jgi:YjbE family integral membrane protein